MENPNPIIQQPEGDNLLDYESDTSSDYGEYEDDDEDLHMYHPHNMLRALQQAFVNSCTEESPRVPQPTEITISLKAHQKAIIYAMKEFEKKMETGFTFQNYKIQSNYGILADTVGAGKSLNILGFISTMKHLPLEERASSKNYGLFQGNRSGYILKKHTYDETIHNRNLIIVPHTLFIQWRNYIQTQSSLNPIYVSTRKEIQQNIKEMFCTHDLVLLTNTMTKEFFAKHQNITWRRMFVDEADSVEIKLGVIKPKVFFTWWVSATWQNIVYHGNHLEKIALRIVDNDPGTFHPDLYTYLKNEFPLESTRSSAYYRTTSQWVSNHNIHPFFASMFVFRNSDAFLESSNAMPDILYQTIQCQTPYGLRVVSDFVSPEIHNMIQGGDYKTAFQYLGISADTNMNLIDAVLFQKQKEIDRLEERKKYYKHDDAIASVNQSIERIRQQIKSIQERFANIEEESCPICMGNPSEENPATITPCCNHMFCSSCIFQTLSSQNNSLCPFCRTTIQLQNLKVISKHANPQNTIITPRLPTKEEALFDFLKQNKDKKILLFSRYDNPFQKIGAKCDDEKIKYRLIKGNKSVIAKAIQDFEKGKVNVLFLNAKTTGAGLNLIQTTHIILLHKMTGAEEKQVVGRAYRLGRTEPLHVIRIEHEHETLKHAD